MKSKFKILLSSILAATMTFTSITANIPVLGQIGGVVDAYADTNVTTWNVTSDSNFSAISLSALATTNTNHTFDNTKYSMNKKTPYTLDFNGLVLNNQGAKSNGQNPGNLYIYPAERINMDVRTAIQVPVTGASKITLYAQDAGSGNVTLNVFEPGVTPTTDSSSGAYAATMSVTGTSSYEPFEYVYTGNTAGYVSFLVAANKINIQKVTVEASATVTATLTGDGASVLDGATVKVTDEDGNDVSANASIDGTTLTLTSAFIGDEYTVKVTKDSATYKGTFTAATAAPEVELKAAASTKYEYNFEGTSTSCVNGFATDSVIAYLKDGTAYTSGTDENADMTLSGLKFHGDNHGLYSNGTITINNVALPAKIVIGGCQYGAGSYTLKSDETGSKTLSFAGKSACYHNDRTNNVVTKYYDGTSENATLTLTVSSAYIPYISVETIDEMPATTDVDGTVVGLNDEDKSAAWLVFSDTEGKADDIYAQVTNNSFSVTLDNDKTYTVAEYGGNSAYNVTTTSFTAEDTTVDVSPKAAATANKQSYRYAFTNGTVIPASGTPKFTSVTSSDGILNMTNVSFNGSQHGLNVKNSTFNVKVAGDCTITLLGCKYGSGNVTATAGTGTVDPSTETSLVATNDGDEIVFNYTGDPTTVTFTSDSNSAYLHALNVTYAVETSDVYVGYAAADVPSGALGYDEITPAIDVVNGMSGDEAVNVYVAAGTYDVGDKPLPISRNNVNVIGAGKDTTTITSDTDGGNGNIIDLEGNATHHAGTIIVRGDNIAFENIKLENSFATTNSSALEIYGQNSNFENCVIYATRDTLRTGDNNPSGAFTNCTIVGFQDVVYGGGTFIFDNCTFKTNTTGGDTRFFAPTGKSYAYEFIINNATIDAEASSSKCIYFARPWNNGSTTTGVNGILVINGYTVTDTASTAFNKGITEKGLYGFDLLDPSSNDKAAKSTDAFFYVKKDIDDDYYNTPNTILNAANTIDTTYTKDVTDEGTDYAKLVGKIKSDFITNDTYNTKVGKIGFVASNTSKSVLIALDTVNQVEGDEDYYTVAYVSGVSVADLNVQSYVQFDGLDIVNGTATKVSE